jgi:hypothetical protein
MIRQLRSLGLIRPSLLAVLVVGCYPALAGAQSLAFRNECSAPIIVQAVCIVPGGVRRDRPYLLNPGEHTPRLMLPGDKIITVYDARLPNRVLFQGALPAGATDLRFAVMPHPLPGRVHMQLIPPPRPRHR